MIGVVTLNPAIDITYEVDRADWAGVNRPHAVHVRAGGKGVNVARTLRLLGAQVRLLGLAGGSELTGRLGDCGLELALTQIRGETRRTVTVVDTGRDQAALFNEPGPLVSEGEYREFFFHYQKAAADCSVIVLTGSLPCGVGAGAYAELIAAVPGVPAILDTSGPALALGAAAGPALVKPNLAELTDLAGDAGTAGQPLSARPASPAGTEGQPLSAPPASPAAATEAGIERVARGLGAPAVVVSLGPDGVLAIDGERTWRARPGERVTGNPTGAGDALVAGLADGLARGLDWPALLRHSVALGAAAVAAPTAGVFAEQDYRRHLAQVTVQVTVPVRQGSR